MTLVPCEITPIWHTPEACDTPYLCVPRPGTVQTIDDRVRAAVEEAGRSSDPRVRQVAVWMVEAVVQP